MSKTWEQLSTDEKANFLRGELDSLRETEAKNLLARADRHKGLEDRVTALEEALRQIALRVDSLGGRNSTPQDG
jgi:hypothetical protein